MTSTYAMQDRLNRRIAHLYATDPQFAAALPDADTVATIRTRELRLNEFFETVVAAYGDRPALGTRARASDPENDIGTCPAPRFRTLSFRETWARVSAVATALRRGDEPPLQPGDVVVIIGFSSADHVVVELACAYLGLVALPLAHNATAAQLRPIIDEVEPRVVAVGAGHIRLAVDATIDAPSVRQVVVFDGGDDDAGQEVAALGYVHRTVRFHTLDGLAETGCRVPAEQPYMGGSPQRLAMILYTSGSTGAPKGAMYTEAMVTKLWCSGLVPVEVPVFNLNFQPLNHGAGRLPLIAAFQAGGTSYFVAEPDLSTLFEDWASVRPTQLPLVPRVVDMLYQRYRASVDRASTCGSSLCAAEAAAAAELRDDVLGGRVLNAFVGTAPLGEPMKRFLDTVLDIHVIDAYGTSEAGVIAKDGVIMRPPVLDYKIIDVPELGYRRSDKPFPRGELAVRTASATPGYFKRPDLTSMIFDSEGYCRTGDVVAEIAPDHISIIDRRNNVIKLSQGEFVAIERLETLYATAPLVRQIFLHGNGDRPRLLAVVVPTGEAIAAARDPGGLKRVLLESLQRTAEEHGLRSFEIPVDIIVENTPFSADDGLLSSGGKLLRPRLIERFGERLEQMFDDLAVAQVTAIRQLRTVAAAGRTVEAVVHAARVVLGADQVDSDVPFVALGGDSLSALTFSDVLRQMYGFEVPVSMIISPAGDLSQLADFIDGRRGSGARVSTGAVHGEDVTELRAADLKLDKFIDRQALVDAVSLPRPTGVPNTVLVTGANGWLGRFLTLELLRRAARRGGTVIAMARARTADAARARLIQAFDRGDDDLMREFTTLAADHLDVVAGDVTAPLLGLHPVVWSRLTRTVDSIVHTAALVNHLLPYGELFGPNVAGTAEVIRMAITNKLKSVSYVSSMAIIGEGEPSMLNEAGDIRSLNPVRINTADGPGTYALGYANSKWAGEILLREAHDLCKLPVAVFRSDMVMAHRRFSGQINRDDLVTRLILSLVVTGIAPRSFYDKTCVNARFDGLPVDFVARAIAAISQDGAAGFRTFNVSSPHDDGVSLDVFIDWLEAAGHAITRVDDHDEWLRRFEDALKALPTDLRNRSVLPLIDAYRRPIRSTRGIARAFQQAAREHGVGEIPRLSSTLIDKYVADLSIAVGVKVRSASLCPSQSSSSDSTSSGVTSRVAIPPSRP